MKEKLKLLPPVLALLSVCIAGWCLVHFESEYLWKAQELNLFLDTPLFLRQQMVTSGWLLTYLGTFFTEFFYHPWLGTSLLCGWWLLLMWLTARTFHMPMKWALVLLVPVALLLLTDVDLGYWIYYLKLRGHFFAATIGTTAAVGAVWLYRLLPARFYLRPLFIVAATLLLYPLIGFYGLLATLLMTVLTWRFSSQALSQRLLSTAAGLASIVVVPLLCYRFVFCQTSLANIWWTGLPLFRLVDETPAYYIPYCLLVAFLLLLAVLYRREPSVAVRRPLLWACCQVVLVGVLAWGVQHWWYRDYNFHKELRMQRCMEQTDWEGMLSEARDLQDEPTRAIVMMKNLALFRLGRQGDEMYHYRTGAKASATPIPLRMTQVVGRSIYYNYGHLNYCYRWCLEDGVEFGWRAEYLKYLTRCALVNGEWQVARKYIGLLRHTRYHRQWAETYASWLERDDAMRQSPEFNQIYHLQGYDDQLSSDNSLVEYYMMNQFANVNTEDTLLQEQTLIAALWLKDIQAFWPRFFHYCSLHRGQHIPTHYQEAACLYGHLEHEVDISGMPFDPQVVQTYNDFMAMAQQYAGMGEDRLRVLMYPRFGKTFYYEYFLIRNQKLY